MSVITRPAQYSIGVGTSIMMAVDFHSALIGLGALLVVSASFFLGRYSFVADNS